MKGIYIVGGYPDKETFEKSIEIIENLGFDFLEIGVPFSEPVADGPVISRAIEDSLKNGVTVEYIRKLLEKIKHFKIQKYIMTYSNIIYSYGVKNFSNDFKLLINSLIIADLPNRMHNFFYEKELEIPIIPFVTPESRDNDIAYIKSLKGDFIYFIGIRGTTGGKINLQDNYYYETIKKIKKITGKKVIVGFGLKNKDDVLNVLKIANGFVIGTEAVKKMNNFKIFENYLKSIV